ncbi:unnamed protein product [Rotaria sp. Silwood1]|nr:unnamed protein product [Rotaria sp. Silwood1]CAF3552957.1 unnamed protein product [Rotaria sp. Silwood1]CAF4840543.1 unnamed protein product [Rotaria sp. Silwood1]
MSASVLNKKQCVLCNKSGGILVCDGCQQAFCGKHVSEHRQYLAGQLDGIMQEHDILQQELTQPSLKKNPLLKKIDKWEKDSIAKIQVAAETARKTLQELLEQSKEKLLKTCSDIRENLRASHEADDFSETDLIQWKKQLKELQLEITSPSSAKLIQNKNAPIYIMTLKTDDSSNDQGANKKEPSTSSNSSNLDLQERFVQTLGSVIVEENGYLAKCVDARPSFAYIRGRFLYSAGCYTIRFRIENCKQPYRIFFGCMASKTALKENDFRAADSVGWFGSNQVYENGRCSSNVSKYGYKSGNIKTNDVLYLIIDCTKKQIRLFHERLKTTCTLSVNDNLASFPWQFLLVLCNPGDSVRILPNL